MTFRHIPSAEWILVSPHVPDQDLMSVSGGAWIWSLETSVEVSGGECGGHNHHEARASHCTVHCFAFVVRKPLMIMV